MLIRVLDLLISRPILSHGNVFEFAGNHVLMKITSCNLDIKIVSYKGFIITCIYYKILLVPST